MSATPGVRLVSLNIEGDKHLPAVTAFLENFRPDLVCLQEVYRDNVDFICRSVFGDVPHCHAFFPMTLHATSQGQKKSGIAILSRGSFKSVSSHYYVGNAESLSLTDSRSVTTIRETVGRVLACANVESACGSTFTICNTHFTWTPDGEADDYQREDVATLLRILGLIGKFVLCGDFNAPRGGEIFDLIASPYKDNVPPGYTTTIDNALHTSAPLSVVVDGMFTTDGYVVDDFRLWSGISDHCALTATVTCTP